MCIRDRPLSVDNAVQVALLNNRGLQARFQDLGITEAEVVQAGRVPNPGFRVRSVRWAWAACSAS